MATSEEVRRWQEFRRRELRFFEHGIKNGLIKPYDDDLLDSLRNVNYGGLSASLIILSKNLCNGYCYDRAALITLGFGTDDFKLVDADVDYLTLVPEYIDESRSSKEKDPHYGNHCFAERTLEDGSTWVYDTTQGLVFEKGLYYRLYRPKITKINDKKSTLKFLRHDFLDDSSIERDKWALPVILPILEEKLTPIQDIYSERLQEELRALKTMVDYDSLCDQIEKDKIVHPMDSELAKVIGAL